LYIIIWEFQVKEGCEAQFEQLYGPAGAWVQLFRRGEGYLGTELLRDIAQPHRYLTLDRWVSAAAYETFQGRWPDEYQALDGQGETLTEQEAWVGSMISVGAG
jgi:heme-degrading monooxygenase HmoA